MADVTEIRKDKTPGIPFTFRENPAAAWAPSAGAAMAAGHPAWPPQAWAAM